MNDNFKKQISDIDDLNEIAQIFSTSTELRERISEYEKDPFSAKFSTSKNKVGIHFGKKGDTIYLLGDFNSNDKDNSSTVEIILDAMDNGLLTSAQVLDNGLFAGLIESSSKNKLGFDITTVSEMSEKDFLFLDNNPAILVSTSSDKEGKFVDFIYNNALEITLLGHVTKGELRIDDKSFGYIADYID
ncbi:MAG: hypothetical protein PHP33_02050 [Bacteroidales bacterium]|nr:hypothetical protein [Bacteroidales bacterium]